MVLQGWEVKSMRAGKAQLTEAYVYVNNGEASCIGAHLAPLTTTSTHVIADPTRTRKLLLNRSELEQLDRRRRARGYTLVPLEMYWKAGRAKLAIGVAKGKKQHDKRAIEKDRDWQRDKARVLKRGCRIHSGRELRVLHLVHQAQRRQRSRRPEPAGGLLLSVSCVAGRQRQPRRHLHLQGDAGGGEGVVAAREYRGPGEDLGVLIEAVLEGERAVEGDALLLGRTAGPCSGRQSSRCTTPPRVSLIRYSLRSHR